MSIATIKPRKRIAALLAVPALVFVFTGCASTSPQSASTNTPSAGTMSFTDWQLANAKCMRAQGVDFPDPSGDGSGQSISMNGSDAEAITAAAKKCHAKLGPPPALSASDKAANAAALQKQLVKAAQCYRASGIDVPDPKPGEGIKVPSDAPSDVVAKCGGSGADTAGPANIGGN